MFYDATNIDQKVVQWVEPTTISSLLHRLMGALASTGYFLRWLRHRLCARACAACCRASHVRSRGIQLQAVHAMRGVWAPNPWADPPAGFTLCLLVNKLLEICDELSPQVAVGETVILLHHPLPLVGVSIAMERESVIKMIVSPILATRRCSSLKQSASRPVTSTAASWPLPTPLSPPLPSGLPVRPIPPPAHRSAATHNTQQKGSRGRRHMCCSSAPVPAQPIG